ncbi:CU044_2847 family protein [Amycolatopsis alkalitolerans]|uniref:Trypsin-co-occurring domain-containing protein n=1 Tax=Amycolatopsis alkalitolerans TaxID=2547244 RepID=A0A5C4LRT8_9PSEU|nr:CU044_2847 family protein [Amycolatopsis alkalitolerans]TNC20297.1 hypothetical protein FG385_31040 [Amycolatopsis alkalitolerans]
MAELMSFPLDDGGQVLVEVDEQEPGLVQASRAGDVIEAGVSSFGAALARVKDAAGEALRQFRQLPAGPDEVQLEFGVRLNAQAGAVIAKTGVDGHFKVKLTWREDG